MDLRTAIRKLEVIYNATAAEALKRKEEEAKLDDFGKLRKQIHRDVKEIRKMIKDREAFSKGALREQAEFSHKIRVQIKAVKEKVNDLSSILKEEERKLGKLKSGNQKFKELEDSVLVHRDIVDLCMKHIEECEMMEKRRFLDKNGLSSERSALFQGGTGVSPATRANPALNDNNPQRAALLGDSANRARGGGGGGGGMGTSDNESNGLPDIDVDEDLKMIQEKDHQIDSDLKEIAIGVDRVKEMALDMHRELERQNEQLVNMDDKANNAQAKLDNINTQMKNSIEKVMKGDRFLVNCILLVILLAIISFIVSSFTSS